jgi:hypothetical protein
MKPVSARTWHMTGMVATAIIALVLPLDSAVWAQSAPIIYPSAGQSLEKQASDEAACRTWAQQQTGVYPGQAAPGYYGNPSYQTGAPVLGGAARGAALGAVGGAIAGDAGKGADMSSDSESPLLSAGDRALRSPALRFRSLLPKRSEAELTARCGTKNGMPASKDC